MKKLLFVPFAFLAFSCASSWKPIPTEFVVKDKPSENRIEVLFTNETEELLCLLPEHWPNQAGKINQASDYVFLLVADRRFPIQDYDTGYCPEGCALVVRPGERVPAAHSLGKIRQEMISRCPDSTISNKGLQHWLLPRGLCFGCAAWRDSVLLDSL